MMKEVFEKALEIKGLLPKQWVVLTVSSQNMWLKTRFDIDPWPRQHVQSLR